MTTVWLHAFGTGSPFAYSTDGETTWYKTNGSPWAYAGSGGWLWSHESHAALGWFAGKTLNSVSGQALYFKAS